MLNADHDNAAAEAEAAYRRRELRERMYGAATRQMLGATRLNEGDHVLDVAAGTGDQAILAAQLVGATGSVLATDVDGAMLAMAERAAREQGLANVSTRVMDAMRLDLPDASFDAAISRLGLMLLSQPQVALDEIYRVLKPGGRLAALVWSRPENNPLFAPYIFMVDEILGDDGGDAFALSDAEAFSDILSDAGFRYVQVRSLPITIEFPSFGRLQAWWGASFAAALDRLDPAARQQRLDGIFESIRRYSSPEGISGPGELLLGVGVK